GSGRSSFRSRRNRPAARSRPAPTAGRPPQARKPTIRTVRRGHSYNFGHLGGNCLIGAKLSHSAWKPRGGRGPRAEVDIVGGRRVAASQGESTLKVRTLLVAGAAAAVALVPALAAHAAGLVSSCSTSAPTVLA